MKVKLFTLLTFVVCLSINGCYVEGIEKTEDVEVEGYAPVYGSFEETEIKLLDSRPVKNPGKIYVYGNYLLINELKSGIHIFNNSDQLHPTPVGYIQMLGNSDMAINNNVLYADHMGSLVALKVSDFTELEETGNLSLKNWNLGLPPPSGVYFECIDRDQGLVIGWKKVKIRNPLCYAH